MAEFPAAKKRDLTIDFIKGICIILMVIGHSGAPEWLFYIIYSFHMPVFFLVSGYLFKPKYLLEWKTFVRRRITSLWWPFFLWTALCVVFQNVFSGWGWFDEYYSLGDIAKNVAKAALMVKSHDLVGGFWFLRALFLASIVSLAYLKLFGCSGKTLAWGIGVLLTAGVATLYFVPALKGLMVYLLAVVYFLTGILLSLLFSNSMENNEIGGVKRNRVIPLVIASVLLIALEVVYMPGGMTDQSAWTLIPYYLISTCVAVALLIVCKTDNVPFKDKIARIGSRGLDILIFHFLIFRIVTVFFVHYFGLPEEGLKEFPVIHGSPWHWIVYSIAGIAGSLGIGYALERLKRTVLNRGKGS